MLEIRGVRRGNYMYDGKCNGTYCHILDGARVPSGDVAFERGRSPKHALQQHTVHERRRTGGVGVRAHARGSLLTGDNSAPACFPRWNICGLKDGGNQICWGYEVCAGVLHI